MTDRLSCCVPFCKRTRGDRKNDPLRPGMEWLCQDHWKLVPARIKRRRAKIRRIETKTDDQCVAWRCEDADNRAWDICKRYAIERAAGI